MARTGLSTIFPTVVLIQTGAPCLAASLWLAQRSPALLQARGVVTSNKIPRDPAGTSRIMARVRSKDSKAELALRRALHACGFRYRLHSKEILGQPDIVNRSRG